VGSNRARHVKMPSRQQKTEAGTVASPQPAPPAQLCPNDCLANVAHLLSQPLTALRGSLELALLTTQDPAELRLAAEEALEQAEEMVRLVTLLRELAETGTGVADAEAVWLDELAAEVLEDLRFLAESREIRLELDKSDDVQVWAPRARLRQALLKIVHRAIQREPGGRTIQIEILRAGDQGCLEVRTDSTTDVHRAPGWQVEFQPVAPAFDGVKESTSLEWLIAVQIIRSVGGTVLSGGPPAAAHHYRVCLPLGDQVSPQGPGAGSLRRGSR
jgi:K+-sensing histidine kinase KdpD